MESLVRAVTPGIPGFTVAVLNGDDRLAVENHGSQTVTIYGYNEEPYLRMTPDGKVAVNLHSPAYYLNQDRLSDVKVPASADPKAAPQWKVVSLTGRWEFHDHRMHWMAASDPPQVKDRAKRTKIFDWKVPVRTATATGFIEGQLFWRGSSGGPPAALIGVFVAILGLSAAAIVVARRRRGSAAPSAPREEAW
jgi:hypothetical protein